MSRLPPIALLPLLVAGCLVRPVQLPAVIEPELPSPADRWELVALADDPTDWAAARRSPEVLARRMGTPCPAQPGPEASWFGHGEPDEATQQDLARELSGLHQTLVAVAAEVHSGGPPTRLGRGADRLVCKGRFRVDQRALRDLSVTAEAGTPLHQPLHGCVLRGGGQELAWLERAGLDLDLGVHEQGHYTLAAARGEFTWEVGRYRRIRSMPSGVWLELVSFGDRFEAGLTWACGETPWVLVYDSDDGSFETRPCAESDCSDQREE